MYSTWKNSTETAPVCRPQARVGRYLFYPDKTGSRQAEGGRRGMGLFKKRCAGSPLVSVITTAFNAGRFIETAIGSVITQSYGNIEYIVVDAASTDQTVEILTRYEDAIDYFVSEPDEGLYEGMNKGLELAQGDFVIVLNADDWYDPRCIETLVEAVQREGCDLVSALAVETDEYGATIRKIPLMPFGANVKFRMPLRHETMLIARRVYEELGFYDTTYKLIADLKFTQDIYDTNMKYSQLDRYLMYFRKIGMAHKVSEELLSERRLLLRERFNYLAEDDVGFLAGEYAGDPDGYRRLAARYENRKELREAVEALLELHGANRAAAPAWNERVAG